MKHDLEVDLMRLLHGELGTERTRALRARLEREPALAAAYRRLESAWRGLELPPPAPVPVGFAGRVTTHARALRGDGAAAAGTIDWSAAPRWVRATGAAALVAGVLLGAGLGSHRSADERATLAGEPGLTESYWVMVDESAGAPALPSAARGEASR
jgi:hypothetical protein